MLSSKRGLLVCACLSAMACMGVLHLSTQPAAAAPVLAVAGAQPYTQTRAAQLQAMSPEQRAALVQRVAAWDALPRAQREDLRARYLAWQALDAGEREQLRAVAAEYATFPPDRQQALRQQFAALDKTQQQGWRLGPALGADYDKLHPLIAYVPAGQRLPLLAVLRAMDASQRNDLAVLAQRTPPQQRQALRAELLATPVAQRAAWLQVKMQQ